MVNIDNKTGLWDDIVTLRSSIRLNEAIDAVIQVFELSDKIAQDNGYPYASIHTRASLDELRIYHGATLQAIDEVLGGYYYD